MHPVDEFLLSEGRDVVWELYHENSKISRAEPHVYFGRHPDDRTIVTMMRGLREVKPYTDREKIALPARLPPSNVRAWVRVCPRSIGRAGRSSPVCTKHNP
jgi:hypothetical protein